MKKTYRRNFFSSARVIIVGFFLVIMVGALLLMLPIATNDGQVTPFSDTLFTATSAVCVTGLIVHDTAAYWSVFGQAVILMLIQIGGMGVVMVGISFAMISGRKIGLMQRSTMAEAIAAPQVGGIIRLTRFILRGVVIIELIGAALLAMVFVPDFGWGRGLWYALFHSVSAFCNAGFDLMGVREHYSSLTSFVGSPLINLVIMALIVIGGIGFLTWEDVKTKKWRIHKYRMQTKVILTVTIGLILLPALYYFFVEFSRDCWQELSLGERVLASVFQAVTPRTAGYNTVDLTKMSDVGQSITMLLMLIGGSPGSTAGGMKTTTMAVLFASAFAVFHHREDALLFGRRISKEIVGNAAAILLMYLTLLIAGAVIISSVEGVDIHTCLFETASAIGTVGLSLSLTPSLGLISRLILIVLMFFGRVGGLTIVFAAVSAKKTYSSRLPQEKIMVG